MNFLVNRIERQVGFDLNGDGYVGGEGFMNKVERMTHIDFNRDNIIGHPGAFNYGYTPAYGAGYQTGYPPMGYGYGQPPYGYY